MQSDFKSQIKQKWGRMVCPQREELDRLKQLIDTNELLQRRRKNDGIVANIEKHILHSYKQRKDIPQ